MNRRQFLAAAGAAAGSGLWVPRSFAAPLAGSDLNFIFVFNHGGWDMTRVLTPAFSIYGVSMEFNSDPLNLGGLTVVDHPERPSVRSFFETWYERCLILEGVLVSSIAHDDCIVDALCMKLVRNPAQFDGINDPWTHFRPAGGPGRYELEWRIDGTSCPASADSVVIEARAAAPIPQLEPRLYHVPI